MVVCHVKAERVFSQRRLAERGAVEDGRLPDERCYWKGGCARYVCTYISKTFPIALARIDITDCEEVVLGRTQEPS